MESGLWDADPAPSSFYHGVALCASALPTATLSAIESPDGTLDYRTLDRRANQLAHFLIANGVGKNDVVALHAARHLSTFVNLLAIAKVGAAYTPLDISERPARRSVILQDSGCIALLHEGAALGELPEGVRDVDCLALAEEITGFPDSDPGLPEDLDGLAYVLFTSGSTGRPKGVAMPHVCLANLLAWHARARPGSGARRTLQFCSLSFDFSFHEIFSTLTGGGTLVLVPDAVRRDPVELARLIHAQRIERIFLPVSALLQWAEVVTEDTKPTALKEIITTGEQMKVTDALRSICRHHGVILHNHYGGTEFQDATALTLAGDPRHWPALPGIGHPIDNVTVRIFGSDLEPVPDGQSGFIHIGGAGLAKGYVSRPELDAERFILDPRDGMRLYATGDIGLRAHDGSFESHGRADDQVKIRGVRVEPAEVEAVVCQALDVGSCAVVGRELFGRMRLLAYVTPVAEGAAPDIAALSRRLSEQLPDAMVPDAITVLDRLPATDSGKLDRNALPDPHMFARRLTTPAVPPSSQQERQIVLVLQAVLGIGEVGVEDNFFDLGADSLILVALQHRLTEALGVPIKTTALFRWPTVRALACALTPRTSDPGESVDAEFGLRPAVMPRQSKDGYSPIAVVGLAGRFPDAPDVDAFWENIAAGRHAASRLSQDDLEQSDTQLAMDPCYVHSAAPLEGAESFDAAYFDISPREATLMDPQHRILLELAVHALEDAGYGDPGQRGVVGVIAGASSSTYLTNYVAPAFGYGAGRPYVEADLAQFQAKLANDRNYLTSRLAYKLGLTGPSLTVQTACSTSLVAIHLACAALNAGECDLALAGGISLILPQRAGYLYEDGMIRSSDGLCRAFDVDANGTFFSNGGGLVALRRLNDALADGDNICAVIRGSAINNDGALKVGFTAPSLERQIDVIKRALAKADVAPDTIGYVEAHGTGTKIGDRIEVGALREAFLSDPASAPKVGSCSLGAVKANIGHLDEAAGIAGFIKTVEALRHGICPGTPHFTRPNPDLALDDGPFVVHRDSRDWPEGETPRRAGISAFGIGGVNCHMIVEEAPQQSAPAGQGLQMPPERKLHVLSVSAPDETALASLVQAHCEALGGLPAAALPDYCYSNNTGRRDWPLRIGAVGATPEELSQGLVAQHAALAASGKRSGEHVVCFMFPGQGSHAPGAVRTLYETYQAFRDAIDACDAELAGQIDKSLRGLLCDEALADDLANTTYQQPALFALGYACARLWMSWGIRPDMVLGHSLGEYVAACLSGRLSLSVAMRIVDARGRAVAEHARPGRMAAVGLPVEQVSELLAGAEPELVVAAKNAPSQTVVAGPPDAVERFVLQMRQQNRPAGVLPVNQGFHSQAIDPVLEPFAAAASAATALPGRLPMMSSLSGDILSEEPLAEGYWLDHMRRPVDFAGAISAACEAGATVFFEMGARPVLSPLVRQVLGDDPNRSVLDNGGDDVLVGMTRALAQYHADDGWVDWKGFEAPWARQRISVPVYPFQRRRYMLDPARGMRPPNSESVADRPGLPEGSVLLGTELSLPDSRERRFEVVIDPQELSWLNQHRIFGAVVMPAVGYLESMIAAARSELPSGAFSLTEFMVHRALSWPEGKGRRRLHLVISEAGETSREIRMFSRDDFATQKWLLHASGRLEIAPQPLGTTPEELRLAGGEPVFAGEIVTGQDILAAERERQIELGPAFDVVRTARVAPGMSVSELRAPETVMAQQGDYSIHPAVLEAGYLTLTAIYPELDGRRSYVPLGVQSLWFAPQFAIKGQAGDLKWCRARLSPGVVTEKASDPDILRADISFHDAQGSVLGALEGVSVKTASPDRMLAVRNADTRPVGAALTGVCKDTLPLFRSEMVPEPLPPRITAPKKARWLMLVDQSTSDRLQSGLSRSGGRFEPVVIEAGDDLRDKLEHRLAGQAISGVVDARGLSQALVACPDPAAQAIRLARQAPVLFTLCERAPNAPLLIHAALGALRQAPGATMVLANGWLPGFLRALAMERPDCASALVDFTVGTEPEAIMGCLAAEIDTIDSSALPCGRLIGWESGSIRRAQRLRAIGAAALSKARTLRADRTYIVSGGTGAIGRRLCMDLLARGAGRVLVLARGQTAAGDGHDELDTNARVQRVLVDFADVGRAKAVLAELRADADMPPIGGVFHLAGLIDDGAIDRLTAERFERVMVPKVHGAWALHRATLDEPVEQFVLFSSASSTIGAAGQTNYAAANSCLDALADYRKGMDLPALSVGWPSWEGMGLAANKGVAEKLARRGEGSVQPGQALAHLAGWLAVPLEGVRFSPLPFDWRRMGEVLQRWPEFLLSVLGAQSLRNETNSAPLVDALQDIPANRRLDWLERVIMRRLVEILGLTDPAERNTGFFEIGLDSVSAIELRNWLNEGLAIRLPQTVIFDHPTSAQLAIEIARMVDGGGASGQKIMSPPTGGDQLGEAKPAAEEEASPDYVELLAARLKRARESDNGSE